MDKVTHKIAWEEGPTESGGDYDFGLACEKKAEI